MQKKLGLGCVISRSLCLILKTNKLFYLNIAGAKQHLRMRAMFKKRHVDNHLEYLQVRCQGEIVTSLTILFRARGPGMRLTRSLRSIIPTWSLGTMRSMLTLRCQCPASWGCQQSCHSRMCRELYLINISTGVAAAWLGFTCRNKI